MRLNLLAEGGRWGLLRIVAIGGGAIGERVEIDVQIPGADDAVTATGVSGDLSVVSQSQVGCRLTARHCEGLRRVH